MKHASLDDSIPLTRDFILNEVVLALFSSRESFNFDSERAGFQPLELELKYTVSITIINITFKKSHH